MTYKLFIFDFDGTLANTLPWMLSVSKAAAEKYHFKEIHDADLAKLRKLGTREVMKHLNIPIWKIRQSAT